MMNMDLLILLVIAAIALFVLSRLYSVLGKDVGAPPKPSIPKLTPVESSIAVKSTPSQISFAGLAALQKTDKTFDPSSFLSGARAAYEMIVTAYAAGDRESLRPLLEDEVFNNYDAAISEREKSGKTAQTDIVRMHEAKITEENVDGDDVFVTVEFHTDLSMIETDEAGETLEGDEAGLAETKEQWTFTRSLNSNDPNWRLFAVAAIA